MDSIKFYKPPIGKTPCSNNPSSGRLAKTALIQSTTISNNHLDCFSGMVTEPESLPATTTQVTTDDHDKKGDSSDSEFPDLHDMLLASKRIRDLLKSGQITESHGASTPQELRCTPHGNDITKSSIYAIPGDSQANALIVDDNSDDDTVTDVDANINDNGDDGDGEINHKTDDEPDVRSHSTALHKGEGINCLVQIVSGSVSPQREDILPKASCDLVEKEANLHLKNLSQDILGSISTDSEISDQGSTYSDSSPVPLQHSFAKSDYVRCLSKAQQNQYAPLPSKVDFIALSVEQCPSESVVDPSSNNLETSQIHIQGKKRQADNDSTLEITGNDPADFKRLRIHLAKSPVTSKRARPSTFMMVRHHIPAQDLQQTTRSGRRIIPIVQHWKLEKVDRSWDGTIQGVERVKEVQVDRSVKSGPARLRAVEIDEVEEHTAEGGSITWSMLAK